MIIDFPTLDLLSTLIKDGFIVVDTEYTIVYANEKYCEIRGLTPEQILHQKVDIIPRSKLRETIETARAVLGDTYGATEDEIRDAIAIGFIQADNSLEETIAGLTYYIARAPIIRGGKVIGAIGVVKSKQEALRISSTLDTYARELQYLRAIMGSGGQDGISALGYDSPRMQEIKRIARKAAACDLPVLLTGETGTGKDMFANAIQKESLRKDKPFIKVNCPAIPEALLESELFGYEPGAFTGAGNKTRKGKFEMAHTGTIFLDEIGDLSIGTQAKLLRVLQEKSFERLGGSGLIHSDFRVIAATNRNLKSLVKLGKFREDLYYRLNTIHISLPPLREHPEDIPRLVRQMIHELNIDHQTYVTLDEDAFVYLQSLYYEGNVRELKNIVERAYALSNDAVLRVEQFQSHAENGASEALSVSQKMPVGRLQLAERTEIENCLIEMDYNCNRVAKKLGISRTTLYRKIKRYSIVLRRSAPEYS